jgi:hypothetical protein
MNRTKAVMLLVIFLAGAGNTTDAKAADNWDEAFNGISDAGDLFATAQVTAGIGQLNSISGVASHDTDGDIYKIHISDPAHFIATTANGAAFDTLLFLFDTAGHMWLGQDDDQGLQSTLFFAGALQVPPAGDFFLAVSPFNLYLWDAQGVDFFDHPAANFVGGLTSPVTNNSVFIWQNPIWQFDHFEFLGHPFGPYVVQLTGAEFAAVPEPAGCAIGLSALAIGMFASRRRRTAR